MVKHLEETAVREPWPPIRCAGWSTRHTEIRRGRRQESQLRSMGQSHMHLSDSDHRLTETDLSCRWPGDGGDPEAGGQGDDRPRTAQIGHTLKHLFFFFLQFFQTGHLNLSSRFLGKSKNPQKKNTCMLSPSIFPLWLGVWCFSILGEHLSHENGEEIQIWVARRLPRFRGEG